MRPGGMRPGVTLQHLAVKLFVANPAAAAETNWVAYFNRWIQAHSAPELLIDVADYRHVHHGPGVLLIGHQAAYSLDETGGVLGLLYTRKAEVTGDDQAVLAQAVGAVLAAAQRVEAETTLRFDLSRLQVTVNDRLLAPNTPDRLEVLRPTLTTYFDRLYGAGGYRVQASAPGRERFAVTVSVAEPPTLAELAARQPLTEQAAEGAAHE
jgi:hypothetical protein